MKDKFTRLERERFLWILLLITMSAFNGCTTVDLNDTSTSFEPIPYERGIQDVK